VGGILRLKNIFAICIAADLFENTQFIGDHLK